MIWIEDLIYDRRKFCLNCNCEKDDVKALKFTVGNNDYGACAVCLCKECRDKLKAIL
jgi:hypothetical protein